MKKIIYPLMVSFMAVSACKKDNSISVKAFDDITYSDIKNKEAKFSTENIVVSTAAVGNILKAGSVIFYKTNLGTYGKFKIVSIDASNNLIIDLVNYNALGNVILTQTNAMVNSTWQFDLDDVMNSVDNTKYDFWWHVSGNGRSIDPELTAIFYIYSKP